MAREHGGFWRRAAAFLVDNIILTTVSILLFVIGLLALNMSNPFAEEVFSITRFIALSFGYLALYQVAVGIVGMAYFTYFHGIVGRTPGKILFGLKVLQANGKDVTPGVAFLRWVGYLVSGIPFHLGFFWVAFDRRKRGWHDMIAGTIVIRIEEPAADTPPTPSEEAETQKSLDKEGLLL